MTFSYDQETDTLYVVLEESRKECEYLEPEAGIVLRVDPSSGKVLTCTVLCFSERVRKQNRIDIPGLHGVDLAPELRSLIR